MSAYTVEGNVAQVETGPGPIFIGALGTALPAEWNSTLDAALVEIGFTVESQELEISTDVEGVEVNERVRAIRWEVTGGEGKFRFTGAQINPRMMQIALGGGTVTETAQSVRYTFPANSSLQRFVLVQKSYNGRDMLVLPAVSSSGSMSWSREKGASVVGLPIELNIEEAANGAQPYYLWDPELLDEAAGDYGVVTP